MTVAVAAGVAAAAASVADVKLVRLGWCLGDTRSSCFGTRPNARGFFWKPREERTPRDLQLYERRGREEDMRCPTRQSCGREMERDAVRKCVDGLGLI